MQKFFLIIVYLLCGTAAINILYNNSFLLIYNGNGGFLGEEIKRIIYLLYDFQNEIYTKIKSKADDLITNHLCVPIIGNNFHKSKSNSKVNSKFTYKAKNN